MNDFSRIPPQGDDAGLPPSREFTGPSGPSSHPPSDVNGPAAGSPDPCDGLWFSLRADLPHQVAVSGKWLRELLATPGRPPVVLAVDEAGWPALRAELNGSARELGPKHKDRPLTSYFDRRSGVMVLHAGYNSAARARRSLSELPDKLVNQSTRSVCVVTLRPKVFRALWEKSKAASAAAAGEAASAGRGGVEAATDARLIERLAGTSARVWTLRAEVKRAAGFDFTVLLIGETGTGKEIVAQLIHDLGPRSNKPFVPVNCANIPADLLESELFGVCRGAFTHAAYNTPGLWTKAGDGTLFLDEIGDLRPDHQAKLLRAIEYGRYFPVGGRTELHSKARVIAATNRNLKEMVASGDFREDLYYRLMGLTIQMPTLAERVDDIPLLAQSLWREITGVEASQAPLWLFTPLQRLSWRGNVRDLRCALIRIRVESGDRYRDLASVAALIEVYCGVA